MAVELRVPEVGESIKEVQIGAWLKKEGDAIERDEALVEIESDKATLELPAPVSGTLSKVLKQKGETVQVGDIIATIGERAGGNGKPAAAAKETAASAPAKQPAAAAAKPAPGSPASVRAGANQPSAPSQPAAPSTPREPSARAASTAPPGIGTHAMPSARRIMEERGVAPHDVTPTGPGG